MSESCRMLPARVHPIVFLLLLLVLPQARDANAQVASTLHGTVFDGQGQPLPGAVVRIVSDPAVHTNHPWRYTLIGDTLGKFSQEGLAPGAYLVMLFPGGQVSTLLRKVELHSGALQQLDLRLPSLAAAPASVKGALPAGQNARRRRTSAE